MIFPHFIVGVPSSADSQPMFGEKMREIPVTKKKWRSQKTQKLLLFAKCREVEVLCAKKHFKYSLKSNRISCTAVAENFAKNHQCEQTLKT